MHKIDVIYHPETHTWEARDGGITATGQTHDKALVNLGIKIYERQTSKPETIEKIDVVLDEYKAVLIRAKTEPDETIRIDLKNAESQILRARTSFGRAEEERAVYHLDNAMNHMEKWLK